MEKEKNTAVIIIYRQSKRSTSKAIEPPRCAAESMIHCALSPPPSLLAGVGIRCGSCRSPIRLSGGDLR